MAVSADFITRYRQASTSWLSALNSLLALKDQYDSLDYGNTLQDSDFAGNSDITKADLVAAVGSVDALNALFGQGHDTNLYKLKL